MTGLGEGLRAPAGKLLRAATLVAVAAFLFRIDFLLSVAALLVLLWAVSVWWPDRALRNVHTQRAHPRRIFHDEEATVTLTVRNDGRLPLPWLEVSDVVPFDLNLVVGGGRWVTTLLAGEHRMFSYRVKGRRRGLYRLGPTDTHAGDVFGIRRHRGPISGATELVVYPKIVPVGRSLLSGRAPVPVLRTAIPLYEDYTRMVGVRSYRTGDSLRRVHWPATAKLGEVVVKEYLPAISRDTVVCLDLSRSSYRGARRSAGPELAVTVAASLLHHVVVSDRLPVGLWLCAHDPLSSAPVRLLIPPRSDRAHLASMLELLARVTVDPAADFAAGLGTATQRLPFGSTLAVVTGSVTGPLAEAVARWRGRGFAPAVFEIFPDHRLSEARRLIGLGVPVRTVESHQDLERW